MSRPGPPHPPAAPDRARRQAELTRACAAARLPLTAQRRAVFDAVLELDTHPTADAIVAHLRARGSRIARATVFRTLEGLAALGVIGRTCHPGRGVRYDRITSQHHHLICLRCDAVIDIVDARLDRLPVPDTSSLGFAVTDFRVQLRGLCHRCRTAASTGR